MKIICVVSAPFKFMKNALLMEAFKARTIVRPLLLHTGQHYNDNMSGVFFRELGLPGPNFFLGASGTGVVKRPSLGRPCRRAHSENIYSTMETLTTPASANPLEMRNIVRVEILNESVDLLDFDTALDCACELALDRQRVSYVVAVNPEKVMTARRSKIIHDFICRADLAIPDGIGIVAAVRILLGKKIERVAGADLMQMICEESGKRGIKIFLYGAKEDVNAGAVEVLKKRYPDIQIVGRQNGYLPESESEDLVARVNASDADVLFLALGSPRQEKWMNQHGDKLRVGMCMGVGGTLGTIVGKVKRAPMAWRRAKLEWLYRLIRQPSRFWRQRRIFYFAARVLLEKARRPKISK